MAPPKSKVILSYYDSLIHNSDVDLLDGHRWLNDTIIGFYLEYLEQEIYKDSDICFIRPEITQCLKLSRTCEYPIFLDPLKFKEKSIAIMPVNDCVSPTLPGGSHWSLLVFSKPEKTFYHIDSSRCSNLDSAKTLSYKLGLYLNMGREWEFKTLSSLQQTNSYDCGVFVLCNIDNVISYFLSNNKLEDINLIKNTDVSKKRQEVKDLINTLSNR